MDFSLQIGVDAKEAPRLVLGITTQEVSDGQEQAIKRLHQEQEFSHIDALDMLVLNENKRLGEATVTTSSLVKGVFYAHQDRLCFALPDAKDYDRLTFENVSEAVILEVKSRNLSFRKQIKALDTLEQGADTHRALNFYFQTGQEADWLVRSACDAPRQTGFRRDDNRGTLIYEEKGGSHRVEISALAPVADGETLEMSALEWLVGRQNADFGFAFFYVCRLLAPPSPLPRNNYAGGWVDLDDIAAKIGYDLDGCTKTEREQLRANVWDYLNYGARALVIGQRKNYRDHYTKKDIETRVDSPPWRILNVERPVQTAMFGEVPRRVELLITKEWEPLLSEAHLAQYLPFAESVASIPANQTAGAWARVLGIALASFWRRKPHEALAGTLQPTRRELLTHYTPKKNPPLELLSSDKPKRAVQYWRDALAMLAERGFLSKEGEATRSVAQMLEPFGRQAWQEAWLDERVDLRPGPLELEPIKERAAAKYAPRPRELGAPKRRPGRPKKRVD